MDGGSRTELICFFPLLIGWYMGLIDMYDEWNNYKS